MTSVPTTPILATRYSSAIGLVILFYDHLLTFEDEVKLIWRNQAASNLSRIGFLINRYVTVAMVLYVAYILSGSGEDLTDTACRRFIWFFAVGASIFVAVSHYAVVARVYSLWDRRKSIKWALGAAFTISISVSMGFAIVSARAVEPFLHYSPIINICIFTQKPWSLPYMLSALTAFDLFLIVLIIVNGLSIPHQTQADVMYNLQKDGARWFAALFVGRLIDLIMAIVGNPADCFVVLSLVWTLCSVANSRLHLRIEGLRFIRYTGSFFEDEFGFEVRDRPKAYSLNTHFPPITPTILDDF